MHFRCRGVTDADSDAVCVSVAFFCWLLTDDGLRPCRRTGFVQVVRRGKVAGPDDYGVKLNVSLLSSPAGSSCPGITLALIHRMVLLHELKLKRRDRARKNSEKLLPIYYIVHTYVYSREIRPCKKAREDNRRKNRSRASSACCGRTRWSVRNFVQLRLCLVGCSALFARNLRNRHEQIARNELVVIFLQDSRRTRSFKEIRQSTRNKKCKHFETDVGPDPQRTLRKLRLKL